MRFMVLVKANKDSEAGAMPDRKLIDAMGKFNEQLVNAGVMLAGEGLRPSSQGARVRFAGGKTSVTRGPFSGTEQLVARFWLWRADSLDEAVAWLKRAPFKDDEVEIRPVLEADDFGDELTPELREQEKRLRLKVEEQHSRRR